MCECLRFVVSQGAANNDVINRNEWLFHAFVFNALTRLFSETSDVAKTQTKTKGVGGEGFASHNPVTP
jgi:hypothetical protein